MVGQDLGRSGGQPGRNSNHKRWASRFPVWNLKNAYFLGLGAGASSRGTLFVSGNFSPPLLINRLLYTSGAWRDNSLPMLQTVFYLCSGFSQAETLSCRRAAVAESIATSTSKSCSPSSAPLLLA